jgi:hypothetical protein
MEKSYEDAVKRVNSKLAGEEDYNKTVVNNLYQTLGDGVTASKLASKAAGKGIVNNKKASIKVSSLADMFNFGRVADDVLIHKSNKDLWAIEADDSGQVHITRLFDNNGEPLRV